MKANELMIGDWVMDGKNIAQITSITCDGIIETTFNESSNIEVIEPIPLTPEILEKIGFERCISSIIKTSTSSVPVCKSNQFADKEFGGNTRIIDMGIHGFTLITDVFGTTEKNKVNHIFYVHQLQHALRLCGIEKEIKL